MLRFRWQMYSIARCDRVLLIINAHLPTPPNEVVDLLHILMVVVIGRDTSLNHMPCELAQPQQTRAFWWLGILVTGAGEYRPDNFALMPT